MFKKGQELIEGGPRPYQIPGLMQKAAIAAAETIDLADDNDPHKKRLDLSMLPRLPAHRSISTFSHNLSSL